MVTGRPSMALKMPTKSRRWKRLRVTNARASIEGDPIAFPDDVAVGRHGEGLVVDLQLFRTDNAAFAPAPRHDRRVTGFAARGGENTRRDSHAAHVFRAGFA